MIGTITVSCADSCFFCTRSACCSHFGESGYVCTRFNDCRPNDEDMDYGDPETGTNYPPDFFD